MTGAPVSGAAPHCWLRCVGTFGAFMTLGFDCGTAPNGTCPLADTADNMEIKDAIVLPFITTSNDGAHSLVLLKPAPTHLHWSWIRLANGDVLSVGLVGQNILKPIKRR